MSTDGHRTTWLSNIAENFSRLSRVHIRFRETTDRQQTDSERNPLRNTKATKFGETTWRLGLSRLDDRHIANVNVHVR